MSEHPSDPEPTLLRMPPAVLGPIVVGLAWGGAVARTWPWSSWADSFVAISSVLLMLALAVSGLAAWHDDVRLRRGAAIALLGWFGCLLLGRLGGVELAIETWSDVRYVWLLLGVTGIAIGGLLIRRTWARWLGIGLGFAGGASAGLNAITQWMVYPGFRLWLLSTFAAAAALLIVNLASSSMTDADEPGPMQALWRSRSPLVFWLRAAIVSSFVAVPMLLVYAWVQPGRLDALVTPAVVLAAWLTVSTVLAVRGRVIGALLLTIGGAGLLALTAVLLGESSAEFDQGVALYYAVFWVPASVSTTIAGARLAGPLWRVLSRR